MEIKHAYDPEPRRCGRRSGHWDHYKENMYTTRHRRYGFCHQADELPRRHAGLQAQSHAAIATCRCACGELGLVHRHELSGALHGLMRVRCFTQDDAHIFMTSGSDHAMKSRALYSLIDEVYYRLRL